MKFGKSLLFLIIALLVSLNLVSCTFFSGDDAESQTASEASFESASESAESVASEASEEELWTGIYVIFREGRAVAGVPSGSVIEDATKYKDYVSENAKYNTYTYFSKLSEKEQWIYRIYEYAFDNNYSNIWFDEKLLEGLEINYAQIIYLLSMDSPLVEQNMDLSALPFTTALKDDNGDYVRDLSGTLVYVSTFFENKKENKTEALEKAQAIVDSLPEGLSDLEKARYFYEYLGKNVKYYEYGRYETSYYLYDALCKGASNCDGYANAFSALCNMAGVDCIEKIHFADEDEVAGHTWNAIRIDGVWYNVDAVASDEVSDAKTPIWFHFGFSDERSNYTYEYKTMTPECKDSLDEIDCVYEKNKENEFITDVMDVLLNSGRDYVLVYSEEKLELSDYVLGFLLLTSGRSYGYSGVMLGDGYYYVFYFE
ncbi:MAG: hypothetical protein IKM32_02135 [Clostridia bacterium]|nr:hypothetical protein [Clostridia bacterium]